MANPTTNYGFVLPTPTDLVTDLPADFEVALQGVDTQMKTNADAAIAKSIVDAKGDLIAATAADTVARLAVGANDHVLTADSTAATGMKWAAIPAGGGITLISTTTLTGEATELTSIPKTYTNLVLVIHSARNNTANGVCTIKPNSSDSLGTYIGGRGFTGSTGDYTMGTYEGSIQTRTTYDRTNNNNMFMFMINNYTQAFFIPLIVTGGAYVSGGQPNSVVGLTGFVKTTSAITNISINNTGGTWSGGTALLYGVK